MHYDTMYYKLENAFEDYYHCHQTLASSRPTFAMTQMEAIPNHVKNKDNIQPEKRKQVMDDY